MSATRMSFFFDFGDASGYLAAVQLATLRGRYGIPVEVRPVDRNALLASVSEPVLRRGESGQAYLRRDQERWAKRLGVKLRWPAGNVASGQALRIVQHVVDHFPERAFELTQWLFEAIWARSAALNEALLDKALESVGLGLLLSARSVDRADAFLSLDASHELALARGIFELPATLVGGTLFFGYDRFDFAERELLRLLLEELPHSQLAEHFAEWLWEQAPQERSAWMHRLDEVELGPRKPDAMARSGFDVFMASIRTLPSLESEGRLPTTAPSAAIRILAVLNAVEAEWSAAVHPHLRRMAEGRRALVFGPSALRLASLDAAKRWLVEHYPAMPFEGMLGPVRMGHELGILHASPASDMASSHLRFVPDEALGYGASTEELLTPQLLSNGLACCLSDALAQESAAQRKAARLGAQLLVSFAKAESSLSARAAALRCQRWVLQMAERCWLFDARGLRFGFEPEQAVELDLEWPPRGDEATGEPLRFEPPRTLLVDDDIVSFGGADSGADVCLSVRGNGLLVSTSESKSLLSANRRFESLRCSSGVVLLLPFLGEQIYSAENVLLKLLSALTRSAKDARLVLVNYWPELSFAALEQARPVLAATTAEHELATLVLTGSRMVELWQPDLAGGAYRVESSGERFPVDLARHPSVASRQSSWLQRLGANFDYLLQLLQSFPRSS